MVYRSYISKLNIHVHTFILSSSCLWVGSGWNGAYYSVYSETEGVQVYGGTLIDGKSVVHNLCLTKSQCYIYFFEDTGATSYDVLYYLCNYQGMKPDILRICIDSNGVCTASPYVETNINNNTSIINNNHNDTNTKSNSTCSTASTEVPFYLFDPTLRGMYICIFRMLLLINILQLHDFNW